MSKEELLGKFGSGDFNQYKAMVVDFGLKIAGVVAVIFVALLLASWIQGRIEKRVQKSNLDVTLGRFFANMSRWVVLIFAGIICLGIFGIQTTSFVAVLGAAGFAVGLAFQGTLSNFSAGVMLLIFRPFKIGDVVSVGGITASVNEIGLFATKLDTPDNRRIIMPNGGIFGSTIENITFHSERRVDIAVGTDYSADLDETRAVLESTAQAVEGQLPEKPSQVVLADLGDSAIGWQIRIWVPREDFFVVKEKATRAIKQALDNKGIGIPFPQTELHFNAKMPWDKFKPASN